MKYIIRIFIIVLFGIMCMPQSTDAAGCTRTYDFNLNGYSANGTVTTVDDAGNGSFTVYNYPYGSPTTLYDVSINTVGSHANNNGKCYTKTEMDTAFTWAFDQGIGLFFAQDDSSAWTHDLSASCGNTHTFTRTVASSQPAGPTGGPEICDAAFRVINRSQNRSAHQAECQALGSGWDLATVTNDNASSVNQYITGFVVVANRVVNSSDFEYPYKCGIETTWPEPLKTLIYNGNCFADIPDTTVYSQALCIDSTPLCNPTDGVCSSSKNTCTPPSIFNDLNDSGNEYKWECLGIDGGANSPVCTSPIPPDDPDDGDGDPACVLEGSNIVPLDSASVFLRVVVPNNPNSYSYDWVSEIDTTIDAFTGSEYTVTTNAEKYLDGVTVTAIHDQNHSYTLDCPTVVVVDPIIVSVDQPIVEPGQTCTLRWSNLDSNATCKIVNRDGDTSNTISGTSGTASLQTRDPNSKYYVKCEYFDSGVSIGSLNSEEVSCIKRGDLIEI